MPAPTIVPGGGLVFGVDKIATTLVFTGNADVDQQLGDVHLRWTNVYKSSAFRVSTTAINDDEASHLSIALPLAPSLTTFFRGAFILFRDSRSVGLSSLQRVNGAAGVGWNLWPFTAEAFVGLESTTQLGVQATGPLACMSSRIDGLEFDQWLLTGNALADWHRIDEDRQNMDVNIRADIERITVDSSRLRVGAGVSTLGRQYLTTIAGSTVPLAIERRDEDRANVDLDFTSNITDVFFLGGSGNVQFNAINRSYGNTVAGVPLTSVERQLGEFMLLLEGRTGLRFSQGNVTLGGALFLRDEQNTATPLYDISDADLNAIRSQETARDNKTSETRMFARGLWTPSVSDSLSAEWTWWLSHYDTPSDLNADDRDVLNALATIRYARSLSSTVTVGLALSGLYVHYVFLKASRSALNNENRVIRFSPFVRITGSVISMQPLFHVIANYTVYDFEGTGATVHSFGFRQISYRDSIRVALTNSLSLEVPVTVQYSEQSTLLWADFAEIPQTADLEYLTKFLIFSRSSTQWDVGVGIRLYSRTKNSLAVTPGLPALAAAMRSWSPEVNIHFTALGGSTLSLLGWYEFQTLTPYQTRELPNLLLQARVAL